MEKKEDLSDFERDMVVSTRQAGLGISETANLLHPQPSLWFTENGLKKKITSEWQLSEWNASLMPLNQDKVKAKGALTQY